MTKARSNAVANAAKGDLTVGNGTNLSGILAVGSNGDTLVADSSTSTGLRWVAPLATLSNPLINAGQDIAQRGTSFTTTSTSQYTLDRWTSRTAAVGGSLVTTREVTNDTTNLPNIQYCVRNRRATGNTNTNALEYYQAVESINSIPYAGKRVTFSVYARKSANFTGTFGAILKSGTGTDEPFVPAFTGNTDVCGSSNQPLTTTWVRYSWNGTISTSAKQIGVIFTHTPSGTAGADDYYEITGVQVDLGLMDITTIPTFRRNGATIQGELAACQRYYWTIPSGFRAPGLYYFSTINYAVVKFPITMRTTPTGTFSPTGVTVYAGSTPYTASATSADSQTPDSATISITTSAATLGWSSMTNFGTGINYSAEL